jgi:nicotinamide-nucleotide amidase
MAIKSLLICVGSELLRGKVNTHASTLSQRLLSLGIELGHEESVPDDLAVLTDSIRRGIERFPLVIVTGGLGPTFDDLSREAAAEATERPLERSGALMRGLQAKFHKARYKSMPPMNARQADVIGGAQIIPNEFGTAPGQWLEWSPGKILILLPGPPRELKPMLETVVLPKLRRTFKTRPRAEGHLHFVGIPESSADQKIRPIIKRYEKIKGIHVDFTILAHLGLVDFDVFVEAENARMATRTADAIVRDIQKRLNAFCYGLGDQYPLEKTVGTSLRAARATLAVAESCTGGLLAAQLTEQPGSSDYFLGGIVTYANRIKETQLAIDPHVLKRYGAVSPEIARALAQNVRERMGSTYGIGITGIAGPGGATAGKPVGLVYVALATPRRTKVSEFQFSGSRDAVRTRAVTAALDALRQELLVKTRRFR